jgi:phosphohistidine phosphatase
MKSLLLLRHAKSSWDDPTLRDIDRPLKKRGVKAARRIGEFMRKRRVRPELVLSSPSRRTVQTVEIVVDAAGLDLEPRYDERIYQAGSAALLEIVSQLEDSVSGVLLVGHNPGLEDLLERLTNEVQPVPTAALARVSLRIKRWSDVQTARGKLEWIVRPKELKRDDREAAP